MVNEETNREDNYQGGIVVRGEEEGIFGVSVKNVDEDEVNDRIDGGIKKVVEGRSEGKTKYPLYSETSSMKLSKAMMIRFISICSILLVLKRNKRYHFVIL